LCNKCLFLNDGTIEEVIYSLEWVTGLLREMNALGVTLDPDSVDYGRALLVTDDPAVADEFGFEEPEEDDDLEHHGERRVKK
jgi:hypothetical protein